MITNDLQNRIHFGDREAFLAVYEEYGRGVYAAAKRALQSDALAKGVLKQTFYTLYNEILVQTEDFDIPVRIRELTEHEILLMRLVDSDSTLDDKAATLPNETEPEPERVSARGAFAQEDDVSIVLPPLEKEHSFRKPKRGLFTRKRKQARVQQKRHILPKILLVLIDIFLLWMLLGVLMNLGYLPALDLGYSWFGQVIASLIAG